MELTLETELLLENARVTIVPIGACPQESAKYVDSLPDSLKDAKYIHPLLFVIPNIQLLALQIQL